MTVIMREAIKPNLLQTLENTPAIVHAGPFGNIAHGNSSVVADLIGIRTTDYLITEAGFGADIGAEKFFNIKCRASGLAARRRRPRGHGPGPEGPLGPAQDRCRPRPPRALLAENPDEVQMGAANLEKQIENITLHGVSPVVAINAFPGDHASEHQAIAEIAARCGARSAVSNHFSQGGKGGMELAEAVAEAAEEPTNFEFLYADEASLREKIETIAKKVYGADGVYYDPAASRQIDNYERNGFGNLPICIAKTHLSISSDPKLRARRRAGLSRCGKCGHRSAPGSSTPSAAHAHHARSASHPAMERIDIDENGEIVGLS